MSKDRFFSGGGQSEIDALEDTTLEIDKTATDDNPLASGGTGIILHAKKNGSTIGHIAIRPVDSTGSVAINLYDKNWGSAQAVSRNRWSGIGSYTCNSSTTPLSIPISGYSELHIQVGRDNNGQTYGGMNTHMIVAENHPTFIPVYASGTNFIGCVYLYTSGNTLQVLSYLTSGNTARIKVYGRA